MPSASTFVASSSGTKLLPYDIFINHCGQDVKHTLASKIYDSLDATGLKVFLDKDELDLADYFPKAIEEAIKSSSLHIAIFSEHYAQSPWCLAQLFCMLQTPSKVMPIFYHVDPSDLRWAIEGKGIYKGAFSDYVERKRYPSELQRWKQALQQASLFTGDIIKKENQGARKNLASI
ncbi:toll/interleukin-1 receptor-like protein isoform X1 [Cryptomeria japonica]|uniref:toll/interleukin-1 receptor-like protein isoform X1 n=2 Tax=Cryptomeria japonica TaxID=3369 RepID=UPI0027DA14E4|nr:toll/interleukin-1 receptor-like protein isoform X1 [Cryptomeria japonica]